MASSNSSNVWRNIPSERLFWLAGGSGSSSSAQKVIEAQGRSCGTVLCLEELDAAAHLRLSLPFFADSLLGAVHLYGPLGIDTILDFCTYLRTTMQEVDPKDFVCLTCSRRPGAVPNSLLLLGAFLILEQKWSAEEVACLLNQEGGRISPVELRFPTPFTAKPHFTADSLSLEDCLRGLETAVTKGWLDRSQEKERRATAAAFDAVPVFSVALDSPNFEHMASIRFWIAADPVTTVEDSSKRPDPIRKCPTAHVLTTDSPSTISTNPDSFFSIPKSVSDPGATLSPMSARSMHSIVCLYKSLSHIHTMDDDGMPSATPKQVWRQRAKHLERKLGQPRAGFFAEKPAVLPTKVHKTDGTQSVQRPADLPAFANFLKDELGCSLLVRGNHGNERGLPAGGSYQDFFQRWGVKQLDVPFADGTAPPSRLVSDLIAAVETLLKDISTKEEEKQVKKHHSGHYSVVVHCKSGLGRSMSLLAALAVALCPGLTAGAFFGWARLVRPACLQTPPQERFLRSLDEERDAVCSCLFACFGKPRTQMSGKHLLGRTQQKL
ncbi:CDC14 [Symbiodinium natans]|uniref:CDC14 protein n=1 Tax=Symbiodinium natans TaxID=878477 RepID=A0A812P0F8_9DINO|nr:CDC14 [Symbiodinium natans]